MHLVRTAAQFPFQRVAGGSVATIGSYDGLHLGHQKLLERVLGLAHDEQLPSIVMSFEPMPKEFFAAASPPARLMRFREKFDALAAAGVDIFFCPRFDQRMRSLAADTFIRQLLIQAMNVRHLVIGDDFRFAAKRQGTVQHLHRAAGALGFELHQAPSVVMDGERVSSTAIREALWNGELERAGKLLGRHYSMSGKVVRGDNLGRKLGFPTANVDLRRRQSPVMGIFAARVRGLAGEPLTAVASVGTRPTFGGTKPLLEVHIFDFDRPIYGRYIHVDFIARLRSEQKFDDEQSLIEQMHRDAARAKELLNEEKP
ncbi:MAG TPA: bifunctional riboflavin kinase/FAD synthetase [Woeseiaceae bacterium]|nr:bifunctional riboflavin kinase/FAD synthetase [Woeseiaceae bacterium]